MCVCSALGERQICLRSQNLFPSCNIWTFSIDFSADVMKSSDGCRIYNSISAEDTSLKIWAEAVSDTSRSEMNIDLIRIKETLWAAVFSGDLMNCFMANSSVKFASLRRVSLWNLSDGLFGQKDKFKGFVQAKHLSRSSLGGVYGNPEPDPPPSKRQWQGKTFEQGEPLSRTRLIWERREGKRQIRHTCDSHIF